VLAELVEPVLGAVHDPGDLVAVDGLAVDRYLHCLQRRQR
jgi:hypothetical protein